MNEYNNALIYGKNKLERIVSVEVKNDTAFIWTEDDKGNVEKHSQPHRYWLLAPRNLGPGFVRLDGDLYYQWGKQYTNEEEFNKAKWQLKKHDIYSIGNPKEAFLVKDGYTYYKGMRPSDVSILCFDIETNGLSHDNKSQVYLISNTFRKAGKIIKKLFSLDEYDNQIDMILDWASWVRQIDPAIMAGHNIISFDLPYLNYVLQSNSYYLDLGRDESEIVFNKNESKFRVDGSFDLHYHKCRIYGREIIDTMFLSYRYDQVNKKYENHGLKYIIDMEKLQKKDRTFYDASKIKQNWAIESERQKIKQYCNDDSDDVLSLFDLMIPASFYLTQSVPKPFQVINESATGSQINALLVRSYLQNRHSIPKANDLKEDKVEGGISFAIPGIYKNVFKVDLKSAYPSQILRFKLYDKEKDPNANFFKLVEHFTLQRFEYKKKMQETGDVYYKNLDAMAKIFINSSYGVTNTNGLNFNSSEIAKKITGETRAVIDMSLRWASGKDYKYWINEFYTKTEEKEEDKVYMSIPQVIPTKVQHDFIICPSDTDSISFCKKDMSAFSDTELKFLLDELNGISPDKMLWENDGLYDCVIAVRAKNYILKTGNKIKIKGSSLKATSKEKALKEFLDKVIDYLLNDKQSKVIELYNLYVKEAMNIKDINRWCSRKTISSKTKESTRANETKIVEALGDSNYSEGDRFYVYFKEDDSLGIADSFDGTYNKTKMVEKVYKTLLTFETVLDLKDFPNYALKRNKLALDKLIEM